MANVLAPANTVNGLMPLPLANIVDAAALFKGAELIVFVATVFASVFVRVEVAILEIVLAEAVAVPVFNQGEITHWDARALSTNFPFDFEGGGRRM